MLNHREVGLLLSELPLKGSYIQKITEHDYHSFTLSLFEKDEKAWLLYVEIATSSSHFCRTDRMRRKSSGTQRFVQYLRSHATGAKITNVRQLPFDRAFMLYLTKEDAESRILFRFYSGPGANVIVLDGENNIKEVMFRRPKRMEIQGCRLEIEERTEEGGRTFEIRPYTGNSFNSFIDRYYSTLDRELETQDLVERIEKKRDRMIAEKERMIRNAAHKVEACSGYEDTKMMADLLSSNLHLVKKGMDRITLDDWRTGERIALPLDPALSARENLDWLYARYQKDKRTLSLARQELQDLENELEELKKHFESLLSDPGNNLPRLRQDAEETGKKGVRKDYPGLLLTSRGFSLLVGRNAKENDEILRRHTRGSDWWVHTRDFAGAYVIIKAQKDKSVPLEVLLDASVLAIHYSKAKNEKKVDLYYTQVKYLRRVKDGRTGLVLATQEKNLTVCPDEDRVAKLLEKGDET